MKDTFLLLKRKADPNIIIYFFRPSKREMLVLIGVFYGF